MWSSVSGSVMDQKKKRLYRTELHVCMANMPNAIHSYEHVFVQQRTVIVQWIAVNYNHDLFPMY